MLNEKHQYDRVAELATLEQQQRQVEKTAWRVAFSAMAGMAVVAILMVVLALIVSGSE